MCMDKRIGVPACLPAFAATVLIGTCLLAGMAGAQSFATVDLPSFDFPDKGAFTRDRASDCAPLPCAQGSGDRASGAEVASRNTVRDPRPPAKEE